MADQGNQGRGDEVEQDGLGRDAAHGDDRSATTGGSYGRNTGRSGDDLLETGEGGGRQGSGSRDASIPRGTDEHTDADDRGEGEGGGRQGRGGDDATELDLRPDAGRRDPTR